MAKRTLLWACLLTLSVNTTFAGTNLQVFYDFGSQGTACANQRTNRVTTTIELFYPDNWGNTFAFIDFDYNIHPAGPSNTAFGAYWEIARCLNFWQQTVARDLSLQVEYDGGLGIGKNSDGSYYGYGINHAALVGVNYFLHTADYKNTFNVELLFKYIADDANMWRVRDAGGHWQHRVGNQVPLQFTFVWKCLDFCTAPGLTFSGFLDVWGQKNGATQSFVVLTEPQLWYNIGQWFKCNHLHIGTEIEFSYNFTGTGWMVNPCLGIKWCFD